ncbi:exo-alpha-sialidase [Archangium minus]|uniref:Exo-alpha-sialidase n=1 Tax=Archangium minus TaxID=83450 RepID=A0ABY9WRW9_9BACT|nr:exo-alpha-sialidase [Archangium minus]
MRPGSYNTDAPSRIMFLNPASTEGRCKMRVRISYDEGKTWNDAQSRRIHETLTDKQTCEQGKGGYSSMTKTADYAVAALIERNEDVGGNPSHRRRRRRTVAARAGLPPSRASTAAATCLVTWSTRPPHRAPIRPIL